MRHGHGLRKLNRTSSHRLAMFAQHDEFAVNARDHQNNGTQSQGIAPRGRADDHFG